MNTAMIKVIKAGIQTSVQDLGRNGHRHFGVCQSGALDVQALKIANSLLGNDEDFAGLEVAAGPLELEFQQPCWIALTGADFNAKIMQYHNGDSSTEGTCAYSGWSYQIQAGQRLLLKGNANGGRAYIAFRGGLDIDLILDSRATDIAAQFGGHQGRCLINGDCLNILATKTPIDLNQLNSIGARQQTPEHSIRALPGPHSNLFSATEKKRFWHADWQLSPASNRMGCRLIGPDIQVKDEEQNLGFMQTRRPSTLASHGVIPGTVQLPSSGQAIVLLADGQTTGGYPIIANVIQADLWRIAQLSRKVMFRFDEVSIAEAIDALTNQQQELYRLQQAIAFKLKSQK